MLHRFFDTIFQSLLDKNGLAILKAFRNDKLNVDGIMGDLCSMKKIPLMKKENKLFTSIFFFSNDVL